MNNGNDKKCAVCGAAASSHCGKCKLANYCSVECQKVVWTAHKISCGKDSLDLTMHRAAQLFQDIFLLMREKTFDNSIKSIEDRGDHLLVTDNPMTPGEVQKFPIHLIKNMSEKKMILTMLICQEPTAYLHDLLLDMLQGEFEAKNTLCTETDKTRVERPSRRTGDSVEKAHEDTPRQSTSHGDGHESVLSFDSSGPGSGYKEIMGDRRERCTVQYLR
jgi:hypothetical protein